MLAENRLKKAIPCVPASWLIKHWFCHCTHVCPSCRVHTILRDALYGDCCCSEQNSHMCDGLNLSRWLNCASSSAEVASVAITAVNYPSSLAQPDAISAGFTNNVISVL